VFKSNHPIKQFSLDIIHSICEDLPQPVDLFISSGDNFSRSMNPYGLIVDDLNLYENVLDVIDSYFYQLKDQGILIMNILGGATLDELIQAMMHADLRENRLITRMLPKISAEGLLSIVGQSKFSYKTVMSTKTTLHYRSVKEIIQSLREIKLTKKLSNNQLTSRRYWESVEEIFSDLYNNSVTLEVITLLAVK
jgi:hypothetical protein